MKINVFIDMDGVLAVYDKDIVKYMYDKDYFLHRPAIHPMLEIARRLVKKNYNVHILTSCIDSPYCIPEKDAWLDKNLPEVKVQNRIYVPYGTVKAEFAQLNAPTKGAINVLIDDYTENLDKWTLEGAVPIKVMNGINGNNGTWLKSGGASINAYSSVNQNLRKIVRQIAIARNKLENSNKKERVYHKR